MSLHDFLRSENEKVELAERARKEEREVNRQYRHDEIDKILAHLLQAILSGKQLPPNKDMLVALPVELNVKPKWVRQVFSGEEPDIPKIIIQTRNSVSLNPDLEWKDLINYPLTQSACMMFLGI